MSVSLNWSVNGGAITMAHLLATAMVKQVAGMWHVACWQQWSRQQHLPPVPQQLSKQWSHLHYFWGRYLLCVLLGGGTVGGKAVLYAMSKLQKPDNAVAAVSGHFLIILYILSLLCILMLNYKFV